MKKFIDKLIRIKKTKFRKLSTDEKVIKIVMLLIKMAVIAALIFLAGIFMMILAIPFILMKGMNDAVQGQANRAMKNYRYIKY